MKKGNRFCILALALIGILGIVIWGVSVRLEQTDSMSYEKVKNGFFAWMDAYVALPEKSEFDIALTYYYFEGEEQYIHKEEITAVALEEISNIKVKNFKVEDVECPNDIYEAYMIIVTVQALELGMSQAETITIYTDTGAAYTCPLGL